MKRFLTVTLATALTVGLAALALASQVVGRCPGKCPLCP
jgi:hypothetical protein